MIFECHYHVSLKYFRMVNVKKMKTCKADVPNMQPSLKPSVGGQFCKFLLASAKITCYIREEEIFMGTLLFYIRRKKAILKPTLNSFMLSTYC
jgi:hypothetical protein